MRRLLLTVLATTLLLSCGGDSSDDPSLPTVATVASISELVDLLNQAGLDCGSSFSEMGDPDEFFPDGGGRCAIETDPEVEGERVIQFATFADTEQLEAAIEFVDERLCPGTPSHQYVQGPNWFIAVLDRDLARILGDALSAPVSNPEC